MIKSLDEKLAHIRADPPGSKAFIIADEGCRYGIRYPRLLQTLGIKPLCDFFEDMQLTGTMMRYR